MRSERPEWRIGEREAVGRREGTKVADVLRLKDRGQNLQRDAYSGIRTREKVFLCRITYLSREGRAVGEREEGRRRRVRFSLSSTRSGLLRSEGPAEKRSPSPVT